MSNKKSPKTPNVNVDPATVAKNAAGATDLDGGLGGFAEIALRVGTAVVTGGASEVAIATASEFGVVGPEVKTLLDIREEVDNFIADAEDIEAEEMDLHINAQCYLLRHLEFYSAFNKDPSETLQGPDGRKKSYEAPPKSDSKSGFTCINGHPQEIVAKLTRKKGLKPLFDIRPDQLALLVPRMRLYKTKGRLGDPSYKFIEFPFKSHTDLLGSNSSRGDGAGIKSFDLVYNGTNPAEAESYIEATLTLYFENIEAFTMARNVDGEKIHFFDLIGYLPSDQKGKRSTVPLENDPNAYSVKVVLGWADPGRARSPIDKKLLKAIQQERRTYDLSLVNHELAFKQNGALEVKVKYIARIESLLQAYKADVINHIAFSSQTHEDRGALSGKSNIAITSLISGIPKLDNEKVPIEASNLDKWLGEAKEIKAHEIGGSQQAKFSQTVEAAKELAGSDSPADRKKLKALLEQAQDLLEERQDELGKQIEDQKDQAAGIKDINEKNLMERYAVLLTKISKMDALRVITLSPEQIGLEIKQPEWIHGSGVDVSKLAESGMSPELIDKMSRLKSPPEPDRAQKTQRAHQANAAEKAVAKLRDGDKDIGATVAVTGRIGDPATYLDIHYFYLGDLIQAAFENVHENDPGGKTGKTLHQLKFLLGPLIVKKATTEGAKDGDKKLVKHPPVMVNLADVPISLDRFIVWFKEKVIKPGKTSYSLKKFITDVASDLIISALGEGCFHLEKQTGKIVTTALTVPYLEGGKSRIASGGSPRISIDDVTEAGELHPENFGVGAQAMENILLVYHDTDGESVFDRKKQEENFNKGVYPITIGSNRGLVKEISFSKSDLPFVKAQYVADQNPAKGIVREPYDAKIRMIGNSVFVPGQTVYIDPYLPGSGTGGTLAHEIGLGGFFTVVTVDHSFDPSGYETLVSARFLSCGDNPKSTPQEVDAGQIAKEMAAREALGEQVAKEKEATAAATRAALAATQEAKKNLSETTSEQSGPSNKRGKSKSTDKSRRRKRKRKKAEPQSPPPDSGYSGYDAGSGYSGESTPPPAEDKDYSDEPEPPSQRSSRGNVALGPDDI